MSGNKTRLFFGCVFVLTLILSAVNGWADESFDHERMDSAGLASALREGLYTESLDSAGVTAWRALMTTPQATRRNPACETRGMDLPISSAGGRTKSRRHGADQHG